MSNLLQQIANLIGKKPNAPVTVNAPDNDHNWWDATKNAASDFAQGGVASAIGGAVQRKRAEHQMLDLPTIGGDWRNTQPPVVPTFQVPSQFPSALPPITAPARNFPVPEYSPNMSARSLPTIDGPTATGEIAKLLVPPADIPEAVEPPAFDANRLPRIGEMPTTPAPVAGIDALTPQQPIPLPPPPDLPRITELPLTTGQKFANAANAADANKANLAEMAAMLAPRLRPSEQTAAEAAQIEGKRYGFQKDENGNALHSENGKPLYEKDRDSDHNWWDVVKSAGLGFAKGGLSGAVGGAIGGALDRNFDEKAIDGIKLNRLNDRFESQTKREQQQQNYEAKSVQTDNIKHDNEIADETLAFRKQTAERNSLLGQVRKMTRYKRGENPAFDAKLEAANIEQPDFEKDKKLKPRFYDGDGRMLTFDDNGATKPVQNEKGEDIVDASKANIYVNGYAVKGRDALNAETAAGVKNTQYDNDDDRDKIKYDNDVREVNAFNGGVDAEIQSKREVVANLQTANDDLRAQRAQLNANPLLNSEQIKQLDQQINSNTNEWRKANGEITALGGKKKPLPIAPKPRQQVAVPTVKSKVDDSAAIDRIKKLFPQESDAQIAARVAQARQDGWIK